MKVLGWGLTDVGRRRAHNEDSFLVSRQLGLFVVADGMGGHVGGGRASRIAVDTIERIISSADLDAPSLPSGPGHEAQAPATAASVLRGAVQAAGVAIFETALDEPELAGMGTTVTALLLHGDRAHIAHVGDSRAYRYRDGQVSQVTEDHSWIREQISAGLLTEEEAKESRFRHVITRSVGFEREVNVDLLTLPLLPGDCFLLCSDGMSNYLTADEVGRVLRETFYSRSPYALIDLACDRGGDDNVTVVVAAAANHLG